MRPRTMRYGAGNSPQRRAEPARLVRRATKYSTRAASSDCLLMPRAMRKGRGRWLRAGRQMAQGPFGSDAVSSFGQKGRRERSLQRGCETAKKVKVGEMNRLRTLVALPPPLKSPQLTEDKPWPGPSRLRMNKQHLTRQGITGSLFDDEFAGGDVGVEARIAGVGPVEAAPEAAGLHVERLSV